MGLINFLEYQGLYFLITQIYKEKLKIQLFRYNLPRHKLAKNLFFIEANVLTDAMKFVVVALYIDLSDLTRAIGFNPKDSGVVGSKVAPHNLTTHAGAW